MVLIEHPMEALNHINPAGQAASYPDFLRWAIWLCVEGSINARVIHFAKQGPDLDAVEPGFSAGFKSMPGAGPTVSLRSGVP